MTISSLIKAARSILTTQIHRPFVKIATALIAVRLTLLFFCGVTQNLIPINRAFMFNFISYLSPHPTENVFLTWDAQWYFDIAAYGYPKNPVTVTDAGKYAFYPLYPIIVRYFRLLTFNSIPVAGMLLNLAFSVTACYFLWKICNARFGRRVAELASWFFIISPFQIFFAGLYTESLFLCTSLASIYYLDRKDWLKSGLFGFLAALTRNVGIFIAIPLLFQLIRAVKAKSWLLSSSIIVSIMLVAVGAGLFPLVQRVNIQDPDMLGKSLQFFSRQSPSPAAFTQFIKTAASFPKLPFLQYGGSQIDVIWMVFSLVLITIAYRYLSIDLFLYNLCLLLAPYVTGLLSSYPRYTSVAFSGYIVLAHLTRKSKTFLWYCSLVSVIMMTLFALLYTHWYWVA